MCLHIMYSVESEFLIWKGVVFIVTQHDNQIIWKGVVFIVTQHDNQILSRKIFCNFLYIIKICFVAHTD